MIMPQIESQAHIVYRHPSDLRPNPKNARKHSDKQIQQIAASITRFGFLVPIVHDARPVILAGHGRWLAAKSLGLTEVPTIEGRFMSEADARAFALAENRIAELSEWDDDLLKGELEHLFSVDYKFEVTGFSLSDLDMGSADVPKSSKPERVELPDPNANAVTRPGDLWSIGPHRLLCGDATQVLSYEHLVGDERAALILTDPPYNVPIDGHVSGLGEVHHREFAMASGEMSPSEFTFFLRTIFKCCVRFSQAASIHYVCMDRAHIREILDASDGIYSKFMQMLVWKKDNAGMGAFYRSAYELVFVFKSGRGKHTNNFGLGETGRYRSNVIEYPGVNTFRKGRKRDLDAHPTPKPVAMFADLMLDCSNKGDLVLDPFAGISTTLVAAHRTGRRGAAIEIDPIYCDAGIRRMHEATGLDATLPDGMTFTEAEAARLQNEGEGNG